MDRRKILHAAYYVNEKNTLKCLAKLKDEDTISKSNNHKGILCKLKKYHSNVYHNWKAKIFRNSNEHICLLHKLKKSFEIFLISVREKYLDKL